MSNNLFSRRCLFILTCVVFFLSPKPAYAYVDPGIVGVLFQYIYVVVFGVLSVWFLRPFKYFKNLFKRIKSRFGCKN
jgi:hypothetical protein